MLGSYRIHMGAALSHRSTQAEQYELDGIVHSVQISIISVQIIQWIMQLCLHTSIIKLSVVWM